MEMDLPPPAPNLRQQPPPLELLDLPADVVDAILVRAPIRDAVRTGALSRAWRHRWQSIPILNFFDPSPAAVDAVLLLHNSPIKRFGLVADSPNHSDRWIAALSRRHPAALVSLHLAFRRFGPVHSSVFSSFPDLDNLVLAGCSLFPPPAFRGFPALRKLVLQDVALPHELALSGLVPACPSLVQMVLIRVTPPTIGLRIGSPNLRFFRFQGDFNGVSFTGGQVLGKVSVTLNDDEMDVGLAEIFCGDAVCDGVFKLAGHTVEALSKLDIPISIPNSFRMLMVLKMRIEWVERRHIMLLFCLLRSAPNLEGLYLRGSSMSSGYDRNMPAPGDDFWEQESVDWLGKLRILEMDDTVFSISEMRFMHLVLARAPVLEKLATIGVGKLEWNEYLFELLKRYYSASNQVQIVYINKREEEDEEVNVEEEVENGNENENGNEVEEEEEVDEEVDEDEDEEVDEDEDEEDEDVEEEEVDEDEEDEEEEEEEEEEGDEDKDKEDEEEQKEEVEEEEEKTDTTK